MKKKEVGKVSRVEIIRSLNFSFFLSIAEQVGTLSILDDGSIALLNF